MIDLHNIRYSYSGKIVLNDISASIMPAERLVLLGVNGCGKTTLLKILNGLIFPDSGEFIFEGKRIDKGYFREGENKRRFRSMCVMLFQSPDVMLFNPTVFDEVAFGLRQIKLSEEEIKRRVIYWLSKLRIEQYAMVSPFELSSGERQRLALASILAIEPRLLLLDEPMANLDPKSQGEVIDLLWELPVTSIISTHNLSIAPELGNRALVLSEEHRLLYDGEVEPLLKNEDILIEANLMHIHRHRHRDFDHPHYHIH